MCDFVKKGTVVYNSLLINLINTLSSHTYQLSIHGLKVPWKEQLLNLAYVCLFVFSLMLFSKQYSVIVIYIAFILYVPYNLEMVSIIGDDMHRLYEHTIHFI